MNCSLPQCVVMGVGNPYGGDDAAGLSAARRLRGSVRDGIAVVEQTGEGTALLEAWRGAAAVILVDAVQSGAPAGTIHRLDARVTRVPMRYFRHSTHHFGVAEAIELGRVLNELPRRLMLFGIEGKDFSPGTSLSVEVDRAVSDVVRQVLRALEAAGIAGAAREGCPSGDYEA
jgi:hydrogenase maturation protease